ncbi:MAG: RpiB/LacA/LacB family sugar-phosphate isomerase, partial [bacterium]|nr:RpiB/LacA/LacB family sugar-phosphate isomerase [bacterium]
MKVYFAADHAGFALKNALIEHVRTRGYEVEDLGAFALDPEDDYPDFMTPLAKRVVAEPDSCGIIIGGSGQGEAMCVNRVPGIHAAVFYGPRRVTIALDIEGGHS